MNEKEAIESLKIISEYAGDNYFFSKQGIRDLKENIKIVLNLLEKQSQEIKELENKIDEILDEQAEREKYIHELEEKLNKTLTDPLEMD